ncbi:hypothetical protein K501DRAFT_197131, partial [Backusella circina FSU 941]
QSKKMKFSIISALFALSSAAVSAYSADGVIYIYENSLPHPKTTFLKLRSDNQVVTHGVACKGKNTLPAIKGALSGKFTTVNNQWDFNGEHDNEIWMGYIKINDKECLTLTEGKALSAEACPSFTRNITVGNKFAWFKDKRNSALWAYGGDADADEGAGLGFAATNLQTKGKTLKGVVMKSNPEKNVFLGLDFVALGDTAKHPTGCK